MKVTKLGQLYTAGAFLWMTVGCFLSSTLWNTVEATSDPESSSRTKQRTPRLRRTAKVLQIAKIDKDDRQRQKDAMESIHEIINRSDDTKKRNLIFADAISNLNHKQIVEEENIFYRVDEMSRIADRNKDFYYMSMEPPPDPKPTPRPTNRPTYRPTNAPFASPVVDPTNPPTNRPTNSPTNSPTNRPTNNPTNRPTNRPTVTEGTDSPTSDPTIAPTRIPTAQPTSTPITRPPTLAPTQAAPIPIPVTEPPTVTPVDTVCGGLTPQERATLIMGQLATYSGGTVRVPGTPQNTAFQWLIEDDEAQVCPEDFLNVQQRYILAVLYFSTSGDQWSNCNALSSSSPGPCPRGDEGRFLSSSDVCFWFGITCNRLRVTGISIDENNLRGDLPNELGFLEQIEDLDFDGELEEGLNFLSGTIPSTLGLLERLVTLDLDSNELTGSIPEELFDASRLTIMDLDSNELTGTLSTGFGNLEELQILFLDNNAFSGSLPFEMGNMEQLRFLRLDRNELSGSIPLEWSTMERLRVLFLNNNGGLSGTIPSFVGNFSELQQLSLFDTGLSGTVPSTLGQLTGLVNLFLHFTDLTGTMPQEICDLRTSGALNFLTADCAGDNPKLQCSQPDCCTVCF